MPSANLSRWNLPFFLVHSVETSKTDQQRGSFGKLGDQLENLWNQQHYYTSNEKSPSLHRALMKMFGLQFLLLGACLFLLEFFSAFGTIFVLKQIINNSDENVFFWCGIASFMAVGKHLAHHYCLLRWSNLETTARAACCSLIHRKILKLKPNCETLQQADEICKLLLADFGTKYLSFAATAAAGSAVIPFFYHSFAETRSILFSFFACVAFASARHCVRRKIRLEISFKTPEDALAKLLSISFEVVVCKFWLVLAAALFSQNSLYIALVIFEHVKTLTSLAPRAFEDFSSMLKSLQTFERLLLNEDVFKRQSPTRRHVFQRKHKRIRVKNGWTKVDASSSFLLRCINFQARDKQLTAIIGGAGSGKSSLMNVLLGETLLQRGKLEMASDVAYSSQIPWIIPGRSVRENIIFNEEIDLKKYEDVVQSCELRTDFPNGEDIILNCRSLQISDTIKAKINLARAVYKSSWVYLLDEPLSELPPETAKKVYERCICGYLKKKCVILACNPSSFELLKNKTPQNFYFMEKGAVVDSGSFKKFAKSFDSFPTSAHYQQSHNEKLSDQNEIQKAESLIEDSDYIFRIFQLVGVLAIGTFLDFLLIMNNFAAISLLFAFSFIFVYVCGNLLIVREKLAQISDIMAEFLVTNSKTSVNVTVLVGKTVTGFGCAGFFGLVLLLVDLWALLASGALWLAVFYVDLMATPARKHLEASLMNQIRAIGAGMEVSMRGVATIRAFKAQNKLINDFDALHDRFRSINYAIFYQKTSTTFWTKLFTLFYVTFINLYKLFTLGNENFGLALSQTLLMFSSSIMASSVESF